MDAHLVGRAVSSSGPPPARSSSHPAPVDGTHRVTRTYVTATVAFVVLAVLDSCVPATYVTGNWWLVLLLVWVMPWPGRRLGDTRPAGYSWENVLQFATLVVLSWLYYRANTALLEAAAGWNVLPVAGPLGTVERVAHDVGVGMATAVLIGRPLHVAFGRRAIEAAFLIATPWFVLTGADGAFDPGAWREHPANAARWLFEALFPPLLLLQACALLRPRHARAMAPGPLADRSTLERLGPFIDRCPRWLATSIVQPALAVALAGIGVRLYYDAYVDLGPAASSALVAIVPLCAVLLTAATVHQLRRQRGRPREPRPLLRLVRGLDTGIAVGVLAALWAWALFVDAPLAEYYAKDALAAVPGPAWSVEHVPEARALRLSGEYRHGVAAGFAEELARHPDVEVVELQGPGGRQSEALRIAYLIESRGLATVVNTHCASACTLAFAAGRVRTLGDGAGLGFHAVSAPVISFDVNRTYDHYLAHRGVDAGFIRQAAEVPPAEMWYPAYETLLAAGVVVLPVQPRAPGMPRS